MKALRAFLKDGRRTQRGSVLSAVLIIVAFLGIISGALMTALSTNFLLSNNLLNRVYAEATVNSAAELGINQLQNSPLNAPCPGPVTTPQLNGQTAVAAIVSCAAVIDRRSLQSSPAFTRIASSNPFQLDGTHVQLPGLDEYLVGDSGGTVFDYRFGQSPRWTLPLGGSVTATPLVMPDYSNSGQWLDLVPVSGSACAPASSCVSVRSDDGSGTPQAWCVMATTGVVRTQPAVGQRFQNTVLVGDDSGVGNVYAMDPTLSDNGTCDIQSSQQSGAPIVAGPVVFPCSCGNRDWVFVLTSSGGSTNLVRFSIGSNLRLSAPATFNLFPPSWGKAMGIAVAPGLPATFAISFSGGTVAVVQMNSAGNPILTASSVSLIGGISSAPYWCSCKLIGIGTGNGTLYILDPNTNLGIQATYSAGSAIRTKPAADAAGNWYFAADNGRLYEVQKPAGGINMTLAVSYGSVSGAPIRSAPVLGDCPAGICVYLGSTDANAYLVSLDARSAVLAACITTASPACSGVNPRLWTSLEVGVARSPQTVHIQGWSYYSP